MANCSPVEFGLILSTCGTSWNAEENASWERLTQEMLDSMLDNYYELRGWDKKTGIPTRTKLESIGLKFVADDLEKVGNLPA